jgi:putative acetyltransferase
MASDTSIHLRRYVTEDLDAVIEVFQRAIREVAARDYNPVQIAAWSQVDRDAWEPWRLTRPTWVAVDGVRVVGFSDLEANGHLDMMFVHPDYQRMGVASQLLRQVESAALAQGLKRIFTEASHTARPFFARRGFQVDAEQVVGKRGARMTNFRMHKLI